MKLRNLVYSALALSPALAAAHPGHEAMALHLHVGVPSALNSINPGFIAAGLFAAALVFSRRFLGER